MTETNIKAENTKRSLLVSRVGIHVDFVHDRLVFILMPIDDNDPLHHCDRRHFVFDYYLMFST